MYGWTAGVLIGTVVMGKRGQMPQLRSRLLSTQAGEGSVYVARGLSGCSLKFRTENQLAPNGDGNCSVSPPQSNCQNAQTR